MGDRLDIDALLIGALYGELDGDDRARLDAHLASHPADRAALDGLRRTRALLVDHGARDFLGSAEPAGAISARLIQEAARRAPAPRAAAGGGVLGFLSGLFRPLAAHPAMSAAAALVIVIGAGSLMMRHGSLEVAQPRPPEATPVATGGDAPPAPPPAVAQPAEPPAPAVAPADGFAVRLNEDDKLAARDTSGEQAAREAERKAGAKPRPPTAPRGGATADKDNALGMLNVEGKARGEDIALKQDGLLDEELQADRGGRVGGAGTTTATAGLASGGQGQAPALDSAVPTMAPRTSDSALLAWARDQHARMVKLVNAGRCTEVGALGAEIARKAPDYYQAAVQNDRALRSCQAYVDEARRAKQPAKAKNVAAEPAQPDDLHTNQ